MDRNVTSIREVVSNSTNDSAVHDMVDDMVHEMAHDMDGVMTLGLTHNSLLSIDAYQKSELECKLFTFIVYVVVFGLMCLCGLVGNSLSFFVLLFDKYSHLPSTFLLRALALADSFFLLTSGTSQMFSALTLTYNITDHPLTPYIRTYLWPLVHMTQLQTVWITVLISVNRFIAICLPFQALRLCSMSRVRLQMVVLIVLTVFYNVPRFYEFTTELLPNSTTITTRESSLKQDSRYNIIYENLLYTLVVFLGPFFILTVLNTRLIREIIRLGDRLHDCVNMRDEEEERNLTVVMVAVVILFLVCQTPACVNHLLFYVIGNEAYLCGNPYYYYYHISNLVVCSSACVNFVIYCIFRHRFRERVYRLFRHGRTVTLYRRGTQDKTCVPHSQRVLSDVGKKDVYLFDA